MTNCKMLHRLNPLKTGSVLVGTFCLMLLPGCGRSAEEKLIGTWAVDKDRLKEVLIASNRKNSKNHTPKADTEMLRFVEQQANAITMNLVFSEHGRVTFILKEGSVGPMTKTGSWRIEDASSDDVAIRFEMKDQDAEDRIVRFLDDDTIEIWPPAFGKPHKRLLVFRRQ